jgi:hypothetical protein
MREFEQKRRNYAYPPFNTVRFVGQIILGWVFGVLVRLCIPEENAYHGLGWLFCFAVPPCAVALGMTKFV